MSYPSFADISRTFAPGWFAAVMGTGVLALTTHGLAQRWPWLAPLAEGLHWFNSALFVLLALPWLTRWLRFRPAAMQTLMHPVQANFYPTFSIALLVLAAQWLTFTPCVDVAMARRLPTDVILCASSRMARYPPLRWNFSNKGTPV
jgi:tellurite resistance protein TehA-like permease